QHLLHGPQIAVELLPSLLIERGGIKRWTWNRCTQLEREGWWHDFRFRQEGVRKRIRDKRRSIRWKQGQGKGAIQRVPLQIDQQMPLCRCVSHHFPNRRSYQSGRPPPGETALDLFNAGDFSPGPDFLQDLGNVGKSRK